MKMGWENWPPYMYLDQSNKLVGVDVDTISAALKMINCEVEYLQMPWRRVLKDAETGELNIVYGAAKTPERELWGNFSIPYRTEVMRLFVLKQNVSALHLENLEDFFRRDFQLAIIRDNYYGPELSKLEQSQAYRQQVARVLSAEQMIRMLLADRVQALIGDAIFIGKEIKRLGASELIEAHSLIVSTTDLHVIFSKQSTTQQQLDGFNQALRSLKEKGTLQEISDKYVD